MTDKIYTYFGFKNGELISVLQSRVDDVEEAIDCDYYISEPQEAETQIISWKNKYEK